MKTCKVITNVSASCRVFTVQFVSIRFIYDFAITVPIDRSFVNFIFGYLSTGLSNMGVSFDYQQGFSAILSQFPVSYPEIKFTIFSNRADEICFQPWFKGVNLSIPYLFLVL